MRRHLALSFGKLTTLTATLVLIFGSSAVQHKAQGQITSATVHGTVTDSTGAVIPNATVTIVNTSTGITTTARTDGHGYYIFPKLQIGGPYTVDIDAAGFQKFESTGLTLNLNDNRGIDAQLQVGGASQTVSVKAAAVQVETSDTQLKQVINARQIEEAPLLSRDATGLQKLVPGTMESNDRIGNFSSNGSQTQSNAYLVDGADITDTSLQSEGLSINPDALAEEDFVTSTLNPEFARNGGAIINQTLKSGTNSFHGSAFEFYRDTFLNNGNYFSDTRPNFHQNIYGGTLGGPVIKNKLFFFLAYQGIRNSVAQTQVSPVFSSSQLQGDFNNDNVISPGTNPLSPLSDNPLPFPVNGCAAGTKWSDCFTNGNVTVPVGSWDPLASKLLQQFVPAPNRVTTNGSYYTYNAPNTLAEDQGIIRADYHLSQNDTIWASSIFQSSPSDAAISYGGSDLPGFPMTQTEHYKIFNASWTHTFTPTTLNEVRAGFYRLVFFDVIPQQVVDPGAYGFNITPQDIGAAGIPNIGVTGLNGDTSTGIGSFLGFSNEGPQPRNDSNLTFADNFTKVLGNHTLKLGVSWEQFVVNNPYYADNSGSYSFGGGGIYSSGDPILDYVLGIPDSYTQTSGGVVDANSREYYAYAQDSYKVTHDFTLNYGVAWDLEAPWQNHQFDGLGIVCWDAGNETSNVYPGGPPGLTYSKDPGCNLSGGPTPKYNHFGPRFGFAWSPSNLPSKFIGGDGAHDFVIRAGFGLYWNRDAEEGQLQNLGNPPGFKESLGARDFGGSPGFADPFSDIAGGGSESNPFPYSYPPVGQPLNWPFYAPLELSTYPKNYTVPYIYNFNLNVQRSLPSNMVLQIGYVGSIGHKLVRAYEGDQITSAGHAACVADPVCAADGGNLAIDYPQYFTQPALVPDGGGLPWYLSVGQQYTDGASNYNAAQVSLTKGLTHGLYFTVAYTYSHGLDNGSGLESSGFGNVGVNPYPGYQHLSYGDSDYDARQRLATSYNYEVPILPSWNDKLLLRETLGGWHISGVTALQTGFPITIADAGDLHSLYCNNPGPYYACPDTPNTSTFKIKSLNPRSATNLWFDPSVFSPETTGTFGNVKRNFFHGPGFNYTNLSLYKNIPLGGDGIRSIELRVDAYNAFNHANFAPPDSNYTDGPFFGAITAVQGSVTADINGDPQPGRAIQLAGKFYF